MERLKVLKRGHPSFYFNRKKEFKLTGPGLFRRRKQKPVGRLDGVTQSYEFLDQVKKRSAC